jgi:hypothetical protein
MRSLMAHLHDVDQRGEAPHVLVGGGGGPLADLP